MLPFDCWDEATAQAEQFTALGLRSVDALWIDATGGGE
jgi:hypothetical protein